MLWSEQSYEAKLALAVKIARNLREFGYSDVTDKLVLEELASPNKTVIGMMAADMLAQNGFTDMEG